MEHRKKSKTVIFLPRLNYSSENSPSGSPKVKSLDYTLNSPLRIPQTNTPKQLPTHSKMSSFSQISFPLNSPSELSFTSEGSPKGGSDSDSSDHTYSPLLLAEIKHKLIVKDDGARPGICQKLSRFASLGAHTMPNLDKLDEPSEIETENFMRMKHIKNLRRTFAAESNKPVDQEFLFVQSMKICQTAEKILNLYGIQQRMIRGSKSDKYMSIEMIWDESFLAKTFEVLIPEVCKFPYSFYKGVGCTLFQFCGSLKVGQVDDHKTLMKRLYQGIFPMNKPHEARKHFYKTLLFLMKEILTNFDKVWLLIQKEDEVMRSPGGSKKPDSEIQLLDIQGREFMKFMDNPWDYFRADVKKKQKFGELFKASIEHIDKNGINDEFWSGFERLECKTEI